MIEPNVDIIFDKPVHESFKGKTEMVQYNAAIIVTGAIEWTSSDRLYQELVLKLLEIGYGLKSLFSFIKLYYNYYQLTFKNDENVEKTYSTESSVKRK